VAVGTVKKSHDLDGLPPLGPRPRQQDPEDSIDPTKAEPRWRLAAKDGELVAQREHFRGELGPRVNRGAKGGDESDDGGDHKNRQAYRSLGRSATTIRCLESSSC